MTSKAVLVVGNTPAATAVEIINPYWDAVRSKVNLERYHSWEAESRQIGSIHKWDDTVGRHELVKRYSWTVTAPDTVAFVAEHLGPRAIDPLAGSGYWAFLLVQHGVDVAASDIAPPDQAKNEWHNGVEPFVPIAQLDAADAVATCDRDRVLLLAWPPYDDPIGARVINAYKGDRIVFIGEGDGGCCGGDDMWTVLGTGWREVADHRPVQWFGLHDYVTVYERLTKEA